MAFTKRSDYGMIQTSPEHTRGHTYEKETKEAAAIHTHGSDGGNDLCYNYVFKNTDIHTRRTYNA